VGVLTSLRATLDEDGKLHSFKLITMRFMTTILLFILSASLVRAQIPKKYCASFQPSATLRITYGNHTVEDGEELPPSVCKHPPTPSIILPPYSHEISRRGIIIVCVDPDSRPHTEVTHWIHSGWHNHSGHLESNSTAEQVYSPPVPPTATEAGWHRYIFLAFAQPELKTRLVDIPSDGECDLQKWTKANGLGMPFAGTYFKTGSMSLLNGLFVRRALTTGRCGVVDKYERGQEL